MNVDQGCCFGGRLTALRWPEQTFVSVPARRTYLEPRGGFRVAVRPPRPEPAPELPLDAT